MIARLINFCQWLHQPHRPLQQTQHLYCPRSRRSRFPHIPLPHQRILDCAFVESPALSMERKEVCARLDRHSLIYLGSCSWSRTRIFENQHLLDATEIFRKLNVHKKVATLSFSIYSPPPATMHLMSDHVTSFRRGNVLHTLSTSNLVYPLSFQPSRIYSKTHLFFWGGHITTNTRW